MATTRRLAHTNSGSPHDESIDQPSLPDQLCPCPLEEHPREHHPNHSSFVAFPGHPDLGRAWGSGSSLSPDSTRGR